MEKQNPSSFEAEFNRLSFLASIATGTTEKQEIQSSINGNYINAGTTVNPAISVNGFNDKHTLQAPTATTDEIDIQKINNILQNTGTQQQNNSHTAKSQVTTSTQFRTATENNIVGIPTTIAASTQQNTLQLTPSISTKTVKAASSSHPILTVPSEFLGRKTGFTQQQLQKLTGIVKMPLNGNSSSAPSRLQTVNPPLVISSTQARPQQTVVNNAGQTILLPANFAGMTGKVLIVNNPGKPPQAIALNQFNQAIQGIQPSTIAIQPQQGRPEQNKPVLLLPNNTQNKTDKSNKQILTQIPIQQPSLQQTHTNNAVRMVLAPSSTNSLNNQIPQPIPVSLSNFQTIRPKNSRTIQPKLTGQSATKNNVLIATSGLANSGIRFAQFPVQSTTQKQKMGVTITPNQFSVPTEVTISSVGQQVLIPSNIASIKTAVSTTTTAMTSAAQNFLKQVVLSKSTSATPSIVTSSMSHFDKTMSLHLQTLEKTDPHLFVQSKLGGGRLQINTAQKISETSTTLTTTSVTTATTTCESSNKIPNLQQQEKIKLYLQNQLQQQQQQLAASIAADKQKIMNMLTQEQQQQQLQQQEQQKLNQQLQQQQKLKLSTAQVNPNQNILLSYSNSATSQSIKSAVNIMPQLLATIQKSPVNSTNNKSQTPVSITTPQRQQAILQNILKQHQQLSKQIKIPTTKQQQQHEQQLQQLQQMAQQQLQQQVLQQRLLQQQQQLQLQQSIAAQQQQQSMIPQLTLNTSTTQQKISNQNLDFYLLQQKLLQAQNQSKVASVQLPSQLNQLTRQIIKPKIDTTSIDKKKEPLINLNSSLADQQPLKLLSSLTNMVNNATASSSGTKLKLSTGNITNTLNNQPKSNLVNIVNPVGSITNTSQALRPILYQLAGSSSSVSITPKLTTTTAAQQMTHAQLIELQKTLLSSHSMANTSTNTHKNAFATGNLQISGASVKVNTKIPVQTTQNRVKSAFMQRNNKGTTQQTLNQVQITPLLQQRNILQDPNTNNSLLNLSKSQLSTTLSKLQANEVAPALKSFVEQIKSLSPQQREILIKQYTASGKLSLPQLQTALANTGNPMVLASILKNRQVVPSAISLAAVPALKKITTSTTQHSQVQKKLASTKTSKGVKRTIAEAQIVPKEAEESQISKRWKSLLLDDQRKFVGPKYKKRLTTYADAFQRLHAYHLSYEPEKSPKDVEKFNLLFENFAEQVQERKNSMLDKFHRLLLRETQLGWPSADDILIGRLYENTEKEIFEHQKKALNDGRAFVVKNEKSQELEYVELAVNDGLNAIATSKQQTDDNKNVTLQLSEVEQLDDRLRIASKDINNIVDGISEGDVVEVDGDNSKDDSRDFVNNDDDDDGNNFDYGDNAAEDDDDDDDDENNIEQEEFLDNDTENEDFEEDDDDDVNLTTNEELEIEEEIATENIFGDYPEENDELAVATSNLLMDLEQDDDEYGLHFN